MVINTRISSSLTLGIAPLFRKILDRLELLSKKIEGKINFQHTLGSVKFQLHFCFYGLQIFFAFHIPPVSRLSITKEFEKFYLL